MPISIKTSARVPAIKQKKNQRQFLPIYNRSGSTAEFNDMMCNVYTADIICSNHFIYNIQILYNIILLYTIIGQCLFYCSIILQYTGTYRLIIVYIIQAIGISTTPYRDEVYIVSYIPNVHRAIHAGELVTPPFLRVLTTTTFIILSLVITMFRVNYEYRQSSLTHYFYYNMIYIIYI